MGKKQKIVFSLLLIFTLILFMIRDFLARKLTNTPFSFISDSLFNLISGFEGFSAVAFWDYKAYSIGYGSQYNWDESRPVQKSDVIDKDTAKKWLLLEADKDRQAVLNMLDVEINDNQLVALSSFAYNEGISALAGSTLMSLLNSGADKYSVASEFDKWIYAGGVVNKGLKNRRAAEKALFLS
jgi:lysozyme